MFYNSCKNYLLISCFLRTAALRNKKMYKESRKVIFAFIRYYENESYGKHSFMHNVCLTSCILSKLGINQNVSLIFRINKQYYSTFFMLLIKPIETQNPVFLSIVFQLSYLFFFLSTTFLISFTLVWAQSSSFVLVLFIYLFFATYSKTIFMCLKLFNFVYILQNFMMIIQR